MDLSLKQVPWDQVLDVVIKTNQLRSEFVGTVVRIVSAEMLQKELEGLEREQSSRADQQSKASLKAETFVLNYAKGADVAEVHHGQRHAARRTSASTRRRNSTSAATRSS